MTAQKKNKNEQEMNKESIINLIRILRSKRIGINNFFLLYKIYRDFDRIIENLEMHFTRSGEKLILYPKELAEEEYSKTIDFGARFLTFLDSQYPLSLKRIPNYPPLMTVKGNTALLKKSKIIAIVGARNATINGLKIAHSFTTELGKNGIVNVSGFARGIDTAVHNVSLDNNLSTIAVFGCGIDVFYPPENEVLAKRFTRNGLMISIFPFSYGVYPYNFPERNRIIAGIGNFGTLVIEASARSGTLITAKQALDYGYDVFAIPGSPMDNHYTGTNQLIKEGAKLVESVEDIMIAQGVLSERYVRDDSFLPNENSIYSDLDIDISDNEIADAKKLIIKHLGYVPISIDDIAEYTKLYIDTVLITLIELSIAGQISWHSGRRVALKFDEKE